MLGNRRKGNGLPSPLMTLIANCLWLTYSKRRTKVFQILQKGTLINVSLASIDWLSWLSSADLLCQQSLFL